jgi:hypothetical protein
MEFHVTEAGFRPVTLSVLEQPSVVVTFGDTTGPGIEVIEYVLVLFPTLQ